MAIKKEIEIVAKTDKAVKNIDKVDDSVKSLDKSTEETSKSVSKTAGKFKVLGSAMKSAGIGLIIALVVTLKETLSQNQKVVDAFSAGFQAVSIVVNTVADALFNSSEGFEKVTNVIESAITIAFTPLKLILLGTKLAISETQLAWEKSFFGGKDADKIEELNTSILETKENIKETGKEAIQSGKDVADNIGGAIDEVLTAAEEAGDALEKVSVKAVFEQSKRLVQLQKDSEIAQVKNQGLIESYDSQAEKLRQLRDVDSKSISERTKANDDLGIVLEKQIETMQKNADIVLKNAQAQYDANKSQENYIALLEAQNEKLAINAQVEGFRSEQIVNSIALKKEAIELDKTITDAEKERQISQLEFEAEQEENEILRLEKQKEVINQEKQIALDKLEEDKLRFKEGTQARVDAEQEYLNRKQELNQQEITNEKEKNEAIIKSEEELQTGKKKLINDSLKLLSIAAGKNKKIQKGIALANTWQGVSEVWSSKSALSEPIATASKVVSTGIVLASGLNAVSNIDASGGGSSSGGGQTQQPAPPSFNLIGNTREGAISANEANTETPIVKAIVVSKDITSAQERDRAIDSQASLG